MTANNANNESGSLAQANILQQKLPDRLFGTDGIRGHHHDAIFNADNLAKLARASVVAITLERSSHNDTQHAHRLLNPLVVIAHDTRASSNSIKKALIDGFHTVGWRVVDGSILPTPGLAFVTHHLQASLGIMISASHNPPEDNGIKFFAYNGSKISDAIEQAIEAFMREPYPIQTSTPLSAKISPSREMAPDAIEAYTHHLRGQLRFCNLSKVRVVVDCAHGAAYKLLPLILEEAGASVIRIGCTPDGHNINVDCGSTHPRAMIDAVRQNQAHWGITLDGDGDRVIMCDQAGTLWDGDHILALFADTALKEGALQKGDAIIGTVMSNGGLDQFLTSHGLKFVRAAVGDRFVAQAMRDYAGRLGAEPSGHIIDGLCLNDTMPSLLIGDGLQVALKMLAIVASRRQQQHTSALQRLFEPWPLKLINLRTSSLPHAIMQDPAFNATITSITQKAGESVHCVVRPSGTERLLRVMVQGQMQSDVDNILKRLLTAVKHTDDRLFRESKI